MTEQIDTGNAGDREASEEELGQATGVVLRESDNDEADELSEGSPLAEFLRLQN